MTSSARMPNSCWGVYRNVSIVNVLHTDFNMGKRPKMLSGRAKSIIKRGGAGQSGVWHLGRYSVGKTARCAYQRAIASAQVECNRLNSMAPEAAANEVVTWGGSA